MRYRFLACLLGSALTAAEPPTSWIDPDTGHRVVRLTREPGSASLYFNQNGYTADGKKLVYTTPEGISVLDLATKEARQVVPGPSRHSCRDLYLPPDKGRDESRPGSLKGCATSTYFVTGPKGFHPAGSRTPQPA